MLRSALFYGRCVMRCFRFGRRRCLPVLVRGFTRITGSFGARQRAEHDIDAFADEFGRRVGMPERSQILDQLLNLLETEFLMRQLTPPKT